MPPTNTSNLSGVNAPTSLIFSFIKTFTVVNFVNTQIDEITSITNSVTVEP